jgi:hypothetical protein
MAENSRFSAAEAAAMILRLQAIKERHAARVRQLANIAVIALREIEEIEEAMDAYAFRNVHPDYTELDFKLTFEIAYRTPADAQPLVMNVTHCRSVLQDVRRDAALVDGN